MAMWVINTDEQGDNPFTFRILPGAIKTIGRAPRADFIVDAALVSRIHCRLTAGAADLEVVDLESTNGTFVNGRRIEGPTKLSGGDTIKLGQNVLELEAARAPATVASPAFTPGPAPATAAPAAAPPAAPGVNAAPAEPFGTYAVPRTKRRRGIASRQWGPMLASWAVVAGTAVVLAIYFADH